MLNPWTSIVLGTQPRYYATGKRIIWKSRNPKNLWKQARRAGHHDVGTIAISDLEEGGSYVMHQPDLLADSAVKVFKVLPRFS